MQKIQRVKLKNGLEIHFLFDKMFTTSSVQVCFRIGWRNDPEEYRGMAHLFEHLVGKRTKKYPEKSEFAKKLDELGIVANAYTGPDITVYYQNQTNENILISIDMLFEAIYNSHFTEEDMEKEKLVVLNEAREYLDNDDGVIWRELVKNLFPNTTLEKFFFGDIETMSRISLEQFNDFYSIYRNPKNMVLYIGTNSQKDKLRIINFLKKFYKENSEKGFFSNSKIPELSDKENQIIKYSKIGKPDRSQINIRIGYRIKKLTKRERVIFGIIGHILTGGFSGTLMQRLRDDMGLIYGIQIGRNMFLHDLGYVVLATTCSKENVSMVINKIEEVINDTQERIIQKDIDRTLPMKIYQQKASPNSYEDLSELIDSVSYGQDYLQSDEGLEILKTIDVEEVKNLMKAIFNPENKTICELGQF